MVLGGINNNFETNIYENNIKSSDIQDLYKSNSTYANSNTIKSKRDIAEFSSLGYKKSKKYFQNIQNIDKAKTEFQTKYTNLRDLMTQLFNAQGITGNVSDLDLILNQENFGDALGTLKVNKIDMETRLKARSQLDENGYWGVEETSNRIVEFAKSLTGGDPSKVDNMITAFKNGFNEVVKKFDGKENLFKINSDTYASVIKKLDSLKKSSSTSSVESIEEDLSKYASKQLLCQAGLAHILGT